MSKSRYNSFAYEIEEYVKPVSSAPYLVYLAITLAGAIGLSVWSAMGKSSDEMEVLDATVVASEEVQREYLVDQALNTKGLSLNIGTQEEPEIIPVEDCIVTADFTSAGNKKVTLTYQENNYTSYVGTYTVRVYFVQSLEVLNKPEKVTVAEDGSFTTDENFRILAKLDGEPKTSVFTLGEEENTVVLSASDYRTSAVEEELDGDVTGHYYAASVSAGRLSYHFNFYNDADRTFLVASKKSVVAYDSVGDEKLTLVVTSAPDTYQHTCTGSSKGYYVHTKGEAQTVTDFAFSLTEREEQFQSSVSETRTESGYTATFGATTFTADPVLWQSAVVNGNIYTTAGGYKLVADSNDRVLTKTTEDGKYTLSLYVSYYTFESSSGSGVSKGYYIFTDEKGKEYKFAFYMQAWTWDYVPLSVVNRQDDYTSISLQDYMLNKYSGPVQIEVKQKGEAYRDPDTFEIISTPAYTAVYVIEMSEFLKAAYNMK